MPNCRLANSVDTELVLPYQAETITDVAWLINDWVVEGLGCWMAMLTPSAPNPANCADIEVCAV